ncbi:MAG: diaminopimelate decarboxylase [Fimbriimonadaceae bacterium]
MVPGFGLDADSAEYLRRSFGTPLYVLDEATIVRSIGSFREALGRLPNKTRISYASKANSTVAVLQVAAREGCHIDVASLGELAAAEMAGVDPTNITFHGNNRSRHELEEALRKGIGEIVLDCLEDIENVAALGQASSQVSLRVNPSLETGLHPKIDTGSALSKFGFTIADGQAKHALTCALDLGLSVTGLHLHIGSQIFDSELHSRGLRALVDFCKVCPGNWQLLNVGGGYGVSYVDEAPLDLNQLFTNLGAIGADAIIGIEPGRALVASAGVTLYTVGAIKHVNGVRMVAVDGGLADNPRPALYGARYRVTCPAKPNSVSLAKIVGRHCENDVLIEEALLPHDLRGGDLLQVHCTGAYNSSMASNYNRYPRPAAVLMRETGAVLVQRRETIEDMLLREVPLGI